VDKNKVLTLLAEYHNKWLANVNALINDENIEAEDIVQDMYLKIHSSKDEIINKAIVDSKPHIGYVNKILYTMYLKAQKEESLKTELKDNHTVEEKQPELNKFNIEKKIDEIVNSFYWFDRKLFNLYRKEFHTIRSLSKATKISHVVVHNTISKCKKKIKRKLKNEI
jgi:DNA-directed RNA polymerase specialized sigma24 family protein